jgi:penicillin amidase/acyl-homoserine-lactone acylase
VLRIVKTGLIGIAGLAFLIVAGILIRGEIEAPGSLDAKPILARAATYDARIARDTYGVPHVSGTRDADVAFGFGYAHAEDDYKTIEEVAIATRGQLAAIKGKDAAVTDYLVHLMRVWENVDARYDTDLSPQVRKVIEAYADGVNYYAALHPDKVTPGFLPLTGRDVAAGFVFKTPFFYGLDKQLMAIFSGKGQQLSKDGKNAFLPTGTPLPIGSNGAAVAPSRSADHATRLLVNSHQPYTGPVAWYEAVLHSKEGWDVAGGFFPGSPFMLHGHNRNLGWANTVNEPDLADVYELKLNPANDNQYLLDGKWHDFEKSEAKIRVKLWGPFWWTVTREVLWSEHGPVLKTDHGAFAIRYAGMNEIRQVEQYYRLDKSQNLAEWRDALRLQALPSINYIYADRQGNIAYVYNGLFPVRKEGFDWKGTLPGDRSDLIWKSYLPFDKIPQLLNPRSGYVFNSNNTPFRATAANDNLDQENFSPTLGIQSNMTNRAYRAEENFGTDPSITREKFRAYKYDITYSARSELAQMIAAVVAVDPGNDADLKAAQAILKSWDRRTNVDSRGAALGVLMGQPVVMAELKGETPPKPIDTLHEAIKTLKTHFNRLDPTWGEVNRFRRGTLDLPIDGGPDTYRAVYGEPQPDGTLTAKAGDTFIMFIEWDEHGKLHSESIHQFGSATLDTKSPHYADQSPLFVGMKTKPVLFEESDLAGHVAEDYKPGERKSDPETSR